MKTTFMDLPNEVLRDIFGYLDLPSRLKMRLNKRLDQVQLSIHNHLLTITLDLNKEAITLAYLISYHIFTFKIRDFWSPYKELARIAHNASVDHISVIPKLRVDKNGVEIIDIQHFNIMAILFMFKADQINIKPTVDRSDKLRLLHLQHLQTLSENFKGIEIHRKCTSVTANDLLVVRKNMIEKSCKAESLTVYVSEETKRKFIEELFGVTVHEECANRTRIYRPISKPVEIFSLNITYVDLVRREGDLDTFCNHWTNRIEICNRNRNISNHSQLNKLELNHPYVI